jgi:hypothetical protein
MPHGKQKFTTSGTFTVPANVTVLWLSMCGGGGGAQAMGGGPYNESGGGGGADAIIDASVSVTPSQTIAVVVGLGGSWGLSAGSWGGLTAFGTYTVNGGGPSYGFGVGGSAGGWGGSRGADGVGGVGGNGGSCLFGIGGTGGHPNLSQPNGESGKGYGAGAGGKGNSTSAGGSGSDGVVIVEW